MANVPRLLVRPPVCLSVCPTVHMFLNISLSDCLPSCNSLLLFIIPREELPLHAELVLHAFTELWLSNTFIQGVLVVLDRLPNKTLNHK